MMSSLGEPWPSEMSALASHDSATWSGRPQTLLAVCIISVPFGAEFVGDMKIRLHG